MGTAQCCCDDSTTKNEYRIEQNGTPLEGRGRVRSIKKAKEISVQTDNFLLPGFHQQTFSPTCDDMFRSSNNYDTISKGYQSSNRQSYFNGVMQGHESRTYDNVLSYDSNPYGIFADKRSFKSG